jgi:pre-rRNA-processing protein TSR3
MNYEVVLDYTERPSKCTVAGLTHRQDFAFKVVGQDQLTTPLRSDVLLHTEGPSIDQTELFQSKLCQSIAVIDCNWKRVDEIMALVPEPIPPKVCIPEGFITAYPRRNKEGSDPSQGLATIEAIFIAAALMGTTDYSLLKEYYFGADFLRINKNCFEKFQVIVDLKNSIYTKPLKTKPSSRTNKS